MAFRNIRIRTGKCGSNLLQTDSIFIEDRRIQFHPHGWKRTSTHNDLTHTLHLREPLRHDRGRGIVNLSFVQHIRREGEHQDRRIRWIYFFICRIVRKIAGQIAASGRNCRLDIAGGGVDIAIQVELQCNTCRSQGTRRSHLRHGRDASKLALERRGDRGRHRLGTCPGQTRTHGDRRKLDLRQRRYRQKSERDRTGESNRGGQEGCGDRPAHKWFRKIHDRPTAQAPAARMNSAPSGVQTGVPAVRTRDR